MWQLIPRSLLAAGLAFAISLVIAPAVIRALKRLKVGQVVRDDGPKAHAAKSGTPTMGGVMIIVAAVLSAAAVSTGYRHLPIALFVTTACGLIGAIDDYISIVARRSLGLRARHKLVLQAVVGLVLGGYAFITPDIGTYLSIPFTDIRIELGAWYIPFAAFTLVAMTNAVNLTDGLDGLAGGCVAVTCFAYVLVSAVVGMSEAGVFAGAVGGACIGFVWWNSHPAAVFMGDSGALALGAALAGLAVITKTELILALMSGVYIAEVLSDTIQVLYFRRTRKRVFRMAPLHHHFELSGMAEPKVVVRFWIAAAFFAALGLAGL
ncbi:MAG: Phospho-N-acetylmuramoyl-pentapeptide-transferase [Firmicutes bacterium ADurb.Bin506]|jgi:phospho-N-acetylmuramoyl-pentapeptide-transferase|nr:MAG: Phospho-N-acetylmuramoyl-pentapeptide-transferase [Firmicutes bacterium ADurb.Bin506]